MCTLIITASACQWQNVMTEVAQKDYSKHISLAVAVGDLLDSTEC